MAIPVKPTKLPRWADVGGAIVEPASGKKDVGWIVEKPPHQYANWLLNLIYQWTSFLDIIESYFTFGDDATKEITFPGDITMGQALTVTGTTTLNGQVTIQGDLQINQKFKTNFSVPHVKEDTENTQGLNQYAFGDIPYSGKYLTVDQTKCRACHIDTALIPPVSKEIVESGVWVNADSATYKYNRARQSTANGTSYYFKFTGISCGVSTILNGDNTNFKAELLSGDGVTVLKTMIKTRKNSTTAIANEPFYLFNNLPFGDYRCRITKLTGTNYEHLYSWYTTKMSRQYPIYQFTKQATAVLSLNDIPKGHFLLTGGWALVSNINAGVYANSRQSRADTVGDTLEIRTYGKYAWVCVNHVAGQNITWTVTVDGGSSGVLNTTLNFNAVGNNEMIWVRLDDGTLTANATHDWKLEATTVPGGQVTHFSMFGSYSDSNDNTHCVSVLMGKDSEKIPVDDSSLTFTGAGWQAIIDNVTSYLARMKKSNAINDYVEVTLPSNCNAVYIEAGCISTGAQVSATIAGSNTVQFSTIGTSVDQFNVLYQLYDATLDGITLSGQVLRLTNTDGGDFDLESIVVEVGNRFDKEFIRVHQKTTRFQSSNASSRSPISCSHYLEIDGDVLEVPTRKPSVDSGLCLGNISVRDALGLPSEDINIEIESTQSAIADNFNLRKNLAVDTRVNGSSAASDTGPHIKFANTGAVFSRMIIKPNRVVG